MLLHGRGFLSSTLSIDSSISTIPEESLDVKLPNPSSVAECDDQSEALEILLGVKVKELETQHKTYKELKKSKEPLIQVKDALQFEITKSNGIINKKSEEVTQLKHKLRHHSENHIQNNVERLEMQLRFNNYKPREEQKILDEICMLQRSSKSLKEFKIKQLETKKYREERQHLIDQRNSIYSEIHSIRLREEDLRRALSELKKLVAVTHRNSDHLRKLRPSLPERKPTQILREETNKKKYDDTPLIRKETSFKRIERRRQEGRDAIKEPYGKEINLCNMLISYVKVISPSPKDDVIEPPDEGLTRTCSEPVSLFGSAEGRNNCTGSLSQINGTFYMKPKPQNDGFSLVRRKSKKNKSKKEPKLKKSIAHPPDVVANFVELGLSVPKDLEQAALALIVLKDKLNHFEILAQEPLVAKSSQNTHKNDTLAQQSAAIPATSVDTTVMQTLANAVVNASSSAVFFLDESPPIIPHKTLPVAFSELNTTVGV